LPTRLSSRRQFQILFGLCLGVFPAAVLGFTLNQNPPDAADSTTSADVVADLGSLVTGSALAAAVLLRFPLLYLIAGLAFILAGLISTIAAADER
jgi:hypothetical protein